MPACTAIRAWTGEIQRHSLQQSGLRRRGARWTRRSRRSTAEQMRAHHSRPRRDQLKQHLRDHQVR